MANDSAASRLLVVASGRPMWLEVMDYLTRRHALIPVIWTGDTRLFPLVQDSYPECLTLDTIDWLRNGPTLGNEDSRPALDWMRTESYQRARRTFSKLCSRLDVLGSFRYVDMDTLFSAVSLALTRLFAAQRVTHALFAEAPHDPVAYVAYEAARHLNVRTSMLQASSVAPMVFCKPSIESTWLAASPTTRSLSPMNEATIASFVDRVADAKSHSDFLPAYIRAQMAHDRSSKPNEARRLVSAIRHYSRRIIARQPSPRSAGVASSGLSLNELYPFELAIERSRSIRRKRLHAAHSAAVDWNAREQFTHTSFAFFPLHYEPERTTVPDGGRFMDQLDALAAIRTLVPPELPIVVKEHYSQFSDRLSGHLGRSPYFYEAAKSVGNVILAPPETDTHWLVKNARVVAVVTGTAGLEAAILGTPVVILGHPWFAGCPGTTRWNPELTWPEVLGIQRGAPATVKRFLLTLHRQHAVTGAVNPSNFTAAKDLVPEAEWLTEPQHVAHLLSRCLGEGADDTRRLGHAP